MVFKKPTYFPAIYLHGQAKYIYALIFEHLIKRRAFKCRIGIQYKGHHDCIKMAFVGS